MILHDVIIRKYGKKGDLFHIKRARIPGDDEKARYRRVMSEAKKHLRPGSRGLLIVGTGSAWRDPRRSGNAETNYLVSNSMKIMSMSSRETGAEFLDRLVRPTSSDGLGIIPTTILLARVAPAPSLIWTLEVIAEWTFLQDEGLKLGTDRPPLDPDWQAWLDRNKDWRLNFRDLALDVIQPDYGVTLADVIDDQEPADVALFMTPRDGWTTWGLDERGLASFRAPVRPGWPMMLEPETPIRRRA